MSNTNEAARKRQPNPLSKEDRARDALSAMRDYEAAKIAAVEKTARLRELRLARDAANAAKPQAPEKLQKRAKKNPTT
jgi:hypothetical protein